MGDLFHEAVPDAFIRKVFDTMEWAHWHTFQILTKRTDRVVEMAASLYWPANVWLGATIEHEWWYWGRRWELLQVPAALHFLSCEPLLGPLGHLGLDHGGIRWVIVGGETGPRPRYMRPQWAEDIRDQCAAAGVPFFFKGHGGAHRGASDPMLGGRIWREMPACLERRGMERALDAFVLAPAQGG
jgi:protein gp37